MAEQRKSVTPLRRLTVPPLAEIGLADWQWRRVSEVTITTYRSEPAVRWRAADRPTGRKRPTGRYALERFLALHDAAAEDVRAFVTTYGPLNVSDRGTKRPGFDEIDEEDEESGWHIERVHWYRVYAEVLGATLRIADYTRRGKPAPADDIDIVLQWDMPLGKLVISRERQTATGPDQVLVRPPQHWEPLEQYFAAAKVLMKLGHWLDAQRALVAAVVNGWIAEGHVVPVMGWRGSAPARLWSGGVWGAIGSQLLDAVLREARVGRCGHCGREVQRKRRPKTGQETWCERRECQRYASLVRMRRSRERRPGKGGRR